MPAPLPQTRPTETLSRPGLGARGGRRGFSLVELLVVITIILVMMALMGAALSNARGSQKRQATQALIAKLDAIISSQFSTYASRDLPNAATPAARGAELRRLVTCDLPDRWTDVAQIAATASASGSPHQRAYAAVWNSMDPKPTNEFAGSECLFMIVMRGGIANCIDCSDLGSSRIGDKDQDGAFEFHDEWGNPIAYILWPGALRLPSDAPQPFFSSTPPFAPDAVPPTMRPLIYSAGPDGSYGLERNGETGNLAAGANCGNPSTAPTSTSAAPLPGAADNITNLDSEARR